MALYHILSVLSSSYGALGVASARVCAWCIVLFLFTVVDLQFDLSCMQEHEHRSTMSAKVVADYKIHIRDVRWARGQFVRVGWQGGRQDGLFVVGFLGRGGGRCS